MTRTDDLRLATDGAQHFASFADALLPELRQLAAALPTNQVGVRVHSNAMLAEILKPEREIAGLASQLGKGTFRPVRCIYFDKSEAANWSLGWHQDRTICVRERVEHHGFGPWTVKQGLHHVAPPMEILARMITLRIHLDDVPQNNAPLMVALGTHRLGRIAETDIAGVVSKHTIHRCLARAGAVWAYATPILHASGATSGGGHRRVLQVDFSGDALPGALEWLGV